MDRNKENTRKRNNILFMPIIMMIGFVPLIVHMYQYNSNLSQFDWFPDDSDMQMDFFFGWKMIAIIMIGIIMFGILVYMIYRKKERLRFESSFYFLFLYTLFVIMSAIFSQYKYWVVKGTYELLEPVWVVAAYVILCYYTYQFVQKEKQIYFVLRFAGVGMAGVTLIGVFQTLGFDIFRSDFGKCLISDPSYWKNINKLTINFAEGRSYTTLYNPNYLSFYFGMLIPLIVCLFVAARKIWKKVLLVIAEIGCVVCLIGSGSDSGWMAVALGVFVVAIVLISRKSKTFILTLISLAFIAVIAFFAVGKTEIGNKIENTVLGTYHMNDRFAVREIKTTDQGVLIDYKGNQLCVSFSNSEDGTMTLSCTDKDGKLLDTVMDSTDQAFMINDSRFTGVSLQGIWISDYNIPGIALTVENHIWRFACNNDGTYLYCNPAGKLVTYNGCDRRSLFREDAMSLRGHIWNMTMPILGKHILIGSGANTYMFEYPQDDYVGQVYIYGENNYEVKAHSWYLQQWVETGLIGTIALLIFLGWYVIRCICIYRRVNLHENLTWTGIGLFAGVVVYLLVGFANDSNVCTAPVFWGLLGLGMAVNRIVVEQNDIVIENKFLGLLKKKTVATKELEVQFSDNIEAVKKDGEAKKDSNKKMSRKQRKEQKKKN